MDSKWMAKFEMLQGYQKEHGHCRIPQRGAETSELKTLSKWVRRQRERYKAQQPTHNTASRPITQEEIEALESIGFCWDASFQRISPHGGTWEDRYQELRTFCQKYQHSRVPHAYPILGEWVQNQRRMYLRMQQSQYTTLTPEKVQLLNEIEFLWKPSLLKTSGWETMYQKLQVYLEETKKKQMLLAGPNKASNEQEITAKNHNKLSLQAFPPATTQEEVLLKHWVHQQRVDYNKFVNGFEQGLSLAKAERLINDLCLDLDLPEDLPALPHEEQCSAVQKTYGDQAKPKRKYVKTEKYRTRPIVSNLQEKSMARAAHAADATAAEKLNTRSQPPRKPWSEKCRGTIERKRKSLDTASSGNRNSSRRLSARSSTSVVAAAAASQEEMTAPQRRKSPRKRLDTSVVYFPYSTDDDDDDNEDDECFGTSARAKQAAKKRQVQPLPTHQELKCFGTKPTASLCEEDDDDELFV